MLISELGYRKPGPREVLRAMRSEARQIIKAGGLPDRHFVLPYKKISDTPLITYSGLVRNSQIGLAGMYRGRHLGSKGWFLLSPTWTTETRGSTASIRRKAVLHRLIYPGHKLVFLSNTEAETDLLHEFGEAAVLSNTNCLIDQDAYRPLAGTPKKYDAIYNAQLVPWKRQDLSLGIESCAFIFYRAFDEPGVAEYEQEVIDRHRAEAPGHVFINEFDLRRRPVRMPFEDVNRHLNAAHVGLCLSSTEGAMLASLEYMLAGLPVVSVRSTGGRDKYFDEEFCLVVDDDPQAVAAGVAEMKARKFDPEHIRSRIKHRIDADKDELRQLVNRVFEDEGAETRLPEGWEGVGQPSSLWTASEEAFGDAHGRKRQPDKRETLAKPAPDETPRADMAQAAETPPAPRPWIGDRPLISMLQISYNQEADIEESVRAVLAQTYSPLEVLFSDDCSQDNTYRIIEKVAADYSGPHKIILNRNPQNLGLVGNFNRCVALSSGRLLVQANGDDISLPERAEKVFRAWARDPENIKLVFCNMDRIDADGNVIRKARSTSLRSLELPLTEVVRFNHFTVGSSNAYSRDMFEKFGPIPEASIVEDHITLLRAFYLGRIAHVDETLVQWRTGGLSWVDDEIQYHPDNVLTGHRIRTVHRMRANHWGYLEEYSRMDADTARVLRKISEAEVNKTSYRIFASSVDLFGLLATGPLVLAYSRYHRDWYYYQALKDSLFRSVTYNRLLRKHRTGLHRQRN